MASVSPPYLAYHPYTPQIDNWTQPQLVSRPTWAPQQQQSMDRAPVHSTSGGPYPNQPPPLALNTPPEPFVLGPALLPLQGSSQPFEMGMDAHHRTVAPMDRALSPLPRGVFAMLPFVQPQDDIYSPISSLSSDDDYNTYSNTSIELDDAPPEVQRKYQAVYREVLAGIAKREKKPTAHDFDLPAESAELVPEDQDAFSSDMSCQSFDDMEIEHNALLPGYHQDPLLDPFQGGVVLTLQAEPVNYVNYIPPVPRSTFEYSPPATMEPPMHSHPTAFRIPSADEPQYPVQQHPASPSPQMLIPEPAQYPDPAYQWTPNGHSLQVASTSPRHHSPEASTHPRRPFTAHAAVGYAPPIITSMEQTPLTSTIEYSPVRPFTAPSSVSFDLHIPLSPPTDVLGQDASVPQDMDDTPEALYHLSINSPVMDSPGATFFTSPLSAAPRTNRPWPVQKPRRRRMYSTASGAAAIKTEVLEGPKKRGRKPKEVKEGEETEEGKSGKKSKEDNVPKAPQLNAPKKPPSAWQLFFKDWVRGHMGKPRVYNGLHADRMSVNVEAKLAALAYHKLTEEEQAPWKDRAKEEKKLYEKELKDWEKNLRPELIEAENQFRAHMRRYGKNGKKSSRANMKNPNIPPKPLSAFLLYQKEITDDPELVRKCFGEEEDCKKRAAIAAEYWRKLPRPEKQIYLDKAAVDKATWEEQRVAYLDMIAHVPSGAALPSFPTLEEARTWMSRKTARLSVVRTTTHPGVPQTAVEMNVDQPSQPRLNPSKA